MLNLPKKKYLMKADLNKKILYFKNINFFLLNNKILNIFLLDGPPFANGDLHIGHILNKTIKDVLLKYFYNEKRILLNNIGWDCHGLPIEQLNYINNLFFINCRKFVCKVIKNQKKDIIKINYFNFYYLYNTMFPKIESLQYKYYFYLLLNNIIKKDFVPILWCFKCSSSLSYSEILYKKINSYSFYLKVKLLNFLIIIWTTTLWSIVNNQAIFFVKNFIYIIYKTKKNNLIFNIYLFYNIIKKIKLKGKVFGFLKGKFFIKKKYIFFLYKILKFYNKKNSFINNYYVDKNIGSGFVHCAPSNGVEDYELYNKKIFLNCYNKFFFSKFYKIFKKISVFFLNKIIFKFLIKRKIILKIDNFNHNYMFCWRHKKPIFYYLSNQIFINLNFKIKKISIKKILLQKIKKILFFPKNIKKILLEMIKFRNDWCISRQRYWGVPLIHNYKNISYYKNITKTFSSHILFFILKKKKSIFDVWFDSSIISIFFKNKKIIIEGKDQIRGWYQSCLITNFFIYFNINIKLIVTHNFCIDNNGDKFSKSSKNFDNLLKIIKINSSEIIKFFLIEHDFSKNIIFNENNLSNTNFSYKFIRVFLKFIVNNFYKFNFFKKKFLLFDLWIVKKTMLISIVLKKLFLTFNYYNVIKIIKLYINFLNDIYLNYVKYNLYICKLFSYVRNSSLFTFYNILFFFKKNLFPILFYTSQELFLYIKNNTYNIKNNVFFSFYLNLKKIINQNVIFYIKNNLINKIKTELINIFNNKIFFNNFFWNWYNIKFFIYIKENQKFCYLSKDLKNYKKFCNYKKICINCKINFFHNREEIKFYL